MKIYTRTGDKGFTTLIGGKHVPKTHIRIEAYGTVDELISHTGMIRDLYEDSVVQEQLLFIQDKLMVCASILAADCEDCGVKIPEIRDSDITYLENAIDEMELHLPILKSFVLPGGHIISSQCHITRTVCRRAERQIIHLSDELFVPETVIRFINRLSDFLFVLARKVLQDYGQKDTLWKSEL
ncbi:MAG TPA: cob(I)yrinic acid a,c-diamide adenosyltransferase [Bacteroidales bacterium]|jgi:cob(I)alamin adenosyltransferase|nr:cob(I)yrinic acid a,c-diamide adenosyltransferase [Bacteroidales bacterium]